MSAPSNASRNLGNAFHALNLVLIAGYGWLLYQESHKGETSVLDPKWLETGFCEPARDIPYWTTHDLSGYTLLVISLLGMAIVRSMRNSSKEDENRGMKAADNLVFYAILGALGHAAGHLLISNATRLGFYPAGHMTPLDDIRNDPLWIILAKIGPSYPLFWMPLVRTYMHNTAAKGRVPLVAAACMLGSLFLPMKFGFAYTQSVLFAGLSVDQLWAQNEKGFEYALWPVMTVIPSAIFSWVEATGCTTHPLMTNFGGHVMYDAFMATSFVLFYLVCWLRNEVMRSMSVRKIKKV